MASTTRKLRCAFVLLVTVLLVPLPLSAQDFRATVVGRITDQAGAAVPGAQVVATNTETNQATRATSNEDGGYVIPTLQPGTYRVEVEQQGFKRFVREGVTLEVRGNPTVDITLEAGGLTETVTVSGDATVLEANDASRGTTITGQALTDLPTLGRNVFSLATLTPGVQLTQRGQATGQLSTFSNTGISDISITGSQPRTNEALLDGVPNTGSDGLIQFVPSVDATQEFKVQTNVFDAEFGRFSGGVINATIKSGKNDFHGSLYEFHRNSLLDARDPFALTRPQRTIHVFGGTIGGPIYFPRFGEGGPAYYSGRDRTFFFFNYEANRSGLPRAFVNTVPTALQRQGIFTETPNVTIYDPATTRPGAASGSFVRSPFPGNRIPAERISPIARQILALAPLPNQPGVVNNYVVSFRDATLDDGLVARIDHNFSEQHRIFARFSRRTFSISRGQTLNNILTSDGETRHSPGFAFDDTYSLNSTTVLNFRYGFTRFFLTQALDSLGYDLASLGFPASFISGLPVQAFPRIQINGYTNFADTNRLQRNAEDSHTVRGGVTKIIGDHTLRAGGEFRLLRSNPGIRGNQTSGSFSFATNFTRGPNPVTNTNNSQQAFASFLLGLPTGGNVQRTVTSAEQSPYYGFYFQDDLRLTSRLTVNLGLRYEFEGAYTERYNRFNRGFDGTVASPIEAQAIANYRANPIPQLPVAEFDARGGLLFAGVDGQPRGLTDLDRNNFAPRIGVAYQLADRTVLRGGYGIFYAATTQLSEANGGFGVTIPFLGTLNNIDPFNTLANPFPSGLPEAPGATEGLSTLLGQGISFVDPTRQQPNAHQYQLSVQQELPGGLLLDAAYVGATGRHLPVNVPVNAVPLPFIQQARQTFVASGVDIASQSVRNPFFGLIPTSAALGASTIQRQQLLRPFPQFGDITQLNSSTGSSRYDAFQFKATRRFRQDFSLIGSYTFAKQLERVRYLNPQDTELVNELSGFDIPHRLVVSGTYDLPFGPGKRFLSEASGVVARLVEGLQLNVIYQAQSGVPLTLPVGTAVSLGRSAQLPAGERSVTRWFDTGAFRRQENFELTTTSRLPDVRTPGRNNFDISIFKTTSITEGVRLQLRGEFFNAFNHPEYSGPDTGFTNANFGRITSANTFARQVQVAVKLEF